MAIPMNQLLNVIMTLEFLIKRSFPEGLSYNEAAQLCLRLYSVADCVPEALQSECNKNDLAVLFSGLSESGFLNSDNLEAVLYGANFHDVNDKGHWIEVIASIFKKGDTVDHQMGDVLASRLTR